MSGIAFDGGLTLALGVSDRKKSTRWYEEMLGFKLLYDVEEIGWCEMETHLPNVRLGLSDVQGVTHGGPVPTIGVDDIQASRAKLEGKGVKFDGENVVHDGLVELASFFDPDGHALMLYEVPEQVG